MPQNRQLQRVLEAGGLMGQRIRAADWSATPLGPPAAWSPALCTALGTCLLSHSPGMLCWGAELTFLYNDAAIGLLGPKHPHHALAAPTSAVWAEVWDDLRPIFEAAMGRGEPHLLRSARFVVRGAAVPRQEVYVDVDYVPIFGADGAPLGVQVLVQDQTAAVLGQRRTALVQQCAHACAGVDRAAEAYRASLRCLRAAPLDLPWAAIYAVDAARARLHLMGTTHGAAAPLTLPAEAALPAADHDDPLLRAVGRVAAGADVQRVDGATAGHLVLAPGLEALPPHVAAVVPLDLVARSQLPAAVFVAIFSPLQPFDEPAVCFLQLLAGVIGGGAAVAETLAQERHLAQVQVAALAREQAGLQRLLQTRDNFLSLASHELKTPLTSLTLQVQMALRRLRRPVPPDLPALEKVFGSIDGQLRRICRLVDDMLDLRRIDSGKLALAREPCSLEAVAAAVVERLAEHLVPPISLVREAFDGRLEGQWDAFRLEQVLVNLLTNAARYGGDTPITVRLARRGPWAQLTVEDGGPGVLPADRERIFARFERAVSGNEASGLGLGLFLVRQVVALHGGTVHAEGRAAGPGAAFVVRLPCG